MSKFVEENYRKLRAALLNRGWAITYYSHNKRTGSIYATFTHYDKRRHVTVRVSDHPPRSWHKFSIHPEGAVVDSVVAAMVAMRKKRGEWNPISPRLADTG